MTPAEAEVTILSEGAAPTLAAGRVAADELWLRPADLPAATGWEVRPEGVCAGDVCIPLDARLEAEVLDRRGGETWFNLTAFARHAGQPYAHDASRTTWSFGSPVHERERRAGTDVAPDFTLPDFDGRLRSLAEFAGKKVFLLTWASW